MNADLYPDTSSCKKQATDVIASLDFLYKDPKTGTGLFHSNLIITTISSSYGQIQGAVDIQDICHSMYFCDEGPVGAITLSLASISIFVISELV